ncbi:cell division protein FtsI/penicillin-binding protein 2 [Kineococcus xinjiangensis]|uniref:Beta-lactamase n=1 Tax=Kineococcus xinjiangensis TaxID=512762 RepID=A0A2S6IFG3_9ACTN|nr:penicillin-binding transpeptidase domain-containing protein [Kineococcus xinjiangensis]PPK92926.1 cell division protein FtsI/penicillin-binding protein 2 [Kineococcus xinjiangensis]
MSEPAAPHPPTRPGRTADGAGGGSGTRPGGGVRRRTALIAGAAGAVVAAGAGAAVVLTRRPDPEPARRAAEAVAAAWNESRWDAVTWDGPVTPAAVTDRYAAATQGLAAGGVTGPEVALAGVDSTRLAEGRARATYDVSWQAGPQRWTYRSTADLVRPPEGEPDTWRVRWAPSLIHPELTEGATLTAVREQPPRAEVLGRDGTPVVTDTQVVDVGVHPARTGDPAATAAAVAEVLDVDAAKLTERIRTAEPDAFVPVLTLRRTDFDAQQERLRPVPGVVFRAGVLPLAPTRAFARSLLGGVGEVTAELVEESGGRHVPGDRVGLSGLQRRYDERLGGAPGVLVQLTGGTGAAARTLFEVPASPGEAVGTTLDERVQNAADEVLATVGPQSAIVAVDVPTGDVLAVANGPATGGDRALTGRFPPGSTFKVVSTLALLEKGLTADEPVPCPPTFTVDGRSFRNFEGEALGETTFRTDFAMSCNTAFADLSSRLDDGDLAAAAARLGIGTGWDVGVDAFDGDVPVTESAVDRAAAAFGQGRTLVSPLALAVAAASVARGATVEPRLVVDPAPEGAAAPPVDLPAASVATLHELMRAVVTDGTAPVLRDCPGGEVFAKTGTAEHGQQVPPETHAWLVGWQGSTAFAVFVAEGRSGGSTAAPVARAFLERLALG